MKIKTAAGCVLCAISAAAATERISLDGTWRFSRDAQAWREVAVPHDWSIESAPSEGAATGKEWGWYEAGKGEYRREFTLGADDLDKHLELVFDGVLRNAEVFVNGALAGKGTRYGYTGFSVSLDGKVKAGGNTLAVKVDNSAQPGSRWYMGSGIVRPVTLEKQTWPYLERGSVNYSHVPSGEGAVDVVFRGTLVGRDGAREGAEKTVRIENAVFWSPETPKLYETEFCGAKMKFGIRDIEWDAKRGFVLNGKSVELHGACVHHDNGPLGAASVWEFEFAKAKSLKDAGFNAVRTSHNPVSESFLAACDELGLLVMDDMFDGRERKKTNGDYCEVFNEDWRKDTEWIVRRDRVHPCVVMWSVGNEILERSEPFAADTTKAMHEFIDKLDGTRPVTQALCLWGEKWEDQDAMAANLDIVGYNYLEYLTESDHERLPERVIVYTETYPRDVKMVWERITKHPYVIGEFVWTGIDYLGESGIGRNFYKDREKSGEHWFRDVPQFPFHGAYCGDIDLTGHRKPISHYRETLWNPDAKTFLAVREPDGWKGEIATSNWSVWPTHDHWTFKGWEGRPVTAEVYTRCQSVRLVLNGKTVAEKPVSAATAWKAEFTLAYEPGELKAVGVRADGTEETAILRTALAPETVRFAEKRIGRYKWVLAEIVDANGTVCPYDDREVAFAGDVVATCSADLKDTVPATSRTRRTFFGRAMAIVRLR